MVPLRKIAILAAIVMPALMLADVVTVGAGSYTDTHPGYDKAGRNGFPTDKPLVSGPAATRPIPSNDWWSSKLTTAQPINMFNYPMAIKTPYQGCCLVRNIVGQAVTAVNPITVGLEGFTATTDPTVYDYTDWTVTFAWDSDDSHLEAICGIGMPMVYFTKTGSRAACVDVTMGSTTVDGNIAIVTGSFNGANYALYAPTGATWTKSGNNLISDLGGKDYFTAALLPDGADAASTARRWAQYAFAFPAGTTAEWAYDQATGKVTTTYSVAVDAKESQATTPLIGLLPHHWANLSSTPALTGDIYSTVRGELRMAATTEFTTELTFRGVLPTLPAVTTDANGYTTDELLRLINNVINDNGLSDWTDSYNDGQLFNRMVQTARIAKEAGLTEEYNSLRETIKNHLERWLTYTPGEVAFLFYYYEPWGALLGYPAGHGQDNNLNDHHFHWGYLIHAAAFLAQDDPQWAADWGPMINLLIRDAASTLRDDPLFPYQRAFSPYAGHCWANGTATSGPGNDQESTSEAMQFHSSLIHWGEATGNREIRDLGIYMYATEQSAVEEYWFDVHHRNFSPSYGYMIASRVFTNSYDIENFWGGGIQGSYGIELYPIHAGSFYLIEDNDWAEDFRLAIEHDTPLLANDDDPNTWHDVYWQFFAMLNPPYALKLYNSYPDRGLKFGISAAQTYQWVHSMAQYGRPCRTVTASYPIAAAFDLGETRTYAVHNYTDETLTVNFSDGFIMEAAPHALTTASGQSPEPWNPEDIDPDTPGDNPGDNPGGDGECTYTDNAASEGTFVAPYTLTFKTNGRSVEVTAKFDGRYTGPVAFLFNETKGFSEKQMTAIGDQTYTAAITGVNAGEVLKLRVKLAFAGGLAVTQYFTYTVGESCEDSGLDIIPDSRLAIYATGGIINVAVNAPEAEVYVWDYTGRLSAHTTGTHQSIDARSWPHGIYFVRVITPIGTTVKEIIL